VDDTLFVVKYHQDPPTVESSMPVVHPNDFAERESILDVLLVVPTQSYLPCPPISVAAAIEQVQKRLEGTGTVISILDLGDDHHADGDDVYDRLRDEPMIQENAGRMRVVIIPLGMEPLDAAQVRAVCWFSQVPHHADIFLADPPSHRDFGEWIGTSCRTPERCGRVELIAPLQSDQTTTENMVLTAFWASESSGHEVRARRADWQSVLREREGLALRASDHEMPVGYLPWELEDRTSQQNPLGPAPVIIDSKKVRAWSWFPSGMVASWIISGYLQAVRRRPIPALALASDSHTVERWSTLERLRKREEELLPSEYSGVLEDVSPRSMGSVALRFDADGRVPWDKLWTSFCDLAMAGGPPHRGILLEPATAQEVAAAPEAYASVVQEIRRGITLASGLPTLDCNSPGWIGVECKDEAMAAWMLRAIIVENILVRREGITLYLPAGPDFKIAKEIKNVITAVAKTHHFWQSHLQMRQPPNPL